MRKILVVLLMAAVAAGLIWLGCGREPTSSMGPAGESQQLARPARADGEVQRVMAVQDRHTPGLMAIRDVVGTATGLGRDGRLAVLVLTKGPGVAGIPKVLEGVPVAIRVTGEIRALGKPTKPPAIDPTSRFARPVPIGVSTGNEGECSAGTIGARVKDALGNVYALSNNHVYALENKASNNSQVLQPGLYDTGCALNPSDVIGTLSEFMPIVFSPSPDSNTVDAAIALSSIDNLGKSTPSNGYGIPKSDPVEAALGQAVQKYGRTTSLTKGPIAAINVTIGVSYTEGTAYFVDQIIVQTRKAFIKAGDSGSLLVTDPDRNPVGLLFAGNRNGTYAIANPIEPVLEAFGVTIDGE